MIPLLARGAQLACCDWRQGTPVAGLEEGEILGRLAHHLRVAVDAEKRLLHRRKAGAFQKGPSLGVTHGASHAESASSGHRETKPIGGIVPMQ